MLKPLLQGIIRHLFPGRPAQDIRAVPDGLNDPHAIEAHEYLQAGDIDQAEHICAQVLRQHAGHPEMIYLMARISAARQEPAAAAEYYREAIRLRPGFTEAVCGLSSVLFESGEPGQAIRNLEQALARQPDNADLCNCLGTLYLRLQDFTAAARAFQRAIDCEPDHAGATMNLGIALQELNRPDEANRCFRSAIRLQPADPGMHVNYGVALRQQEKYEQAIAEFELALSLGRESRVLLGGLGLTCLELGEAERAMKYFQRALALDDRDPDSHLYLGMAWRDMGEFEKSHASLQDALAIDPGCAQAHLNLAFHCLRMGEYARGWDEYAWRFETRESPSRDAAIPECDLSDNEGQGVYVYPEQGLGDQIMFASCLPDLLREAGRVAVECEPRLVSLFRHSFPGADIHACDTLAQRADRIARGGFACQLAMGSLPARYRRQADDFPVHRGYLAAEPSRVEYWQKRLDGLGDGLKIGVSWRGGLGRTRRFYRSIPLEDWQPITEHGQRTFVSLQYDVTDGELVQLEQQQGVRIHHFPEAIADYAETAALVGALDLVISVCTSVIHLGGALGRPVWVLTPYVPEWRYGHGMAGMPWYPAIRLFRQPVLNDWHSVIHEVADALDRFDEGKDVSGK